MLSIIFKNIFISLLLIFYININNASNINFNLNENQLEKLIELLLNYKIRKFLDLISILEGTKNKFDNGNKIDYEKSNLSEYKVLVGYSKINKLENSAAELNIDQLYAHPQVIFTVNGIRSSAAGRYQFIQNTWNRLKKLFEIVLIKMNANEDYRTKIEKIIQKLMLKIYAKDIAELYKYNFQNPNFKNILIERKFGPFWQDLGALILIAVEGKNASIEKILNSQNVDDIFNVLFNCSSTWASFPKSKAGGSFYSEQNSYPIEKIKIIINELGFFNKKTVNRHTGKEIIIKRININPKRKRFV